MIRKLGIVGKEAEFLLNLHIVTLFALRVTIGALHAQRDQFNFRKNRLRVVVRRLFGSLGCAHWLRCSHSER